MKLNVNEIKPIVSRFAQSIGFIEDPKEPVGGMRFYADALGDFKLTVGSGDYCILGSSRCTENNELIDVVIDPTTFITYISHLDCETVNITPQENALVFSTDTSKYQFPLLVGVDVKDFDVDTTTARKVLIDGDMLVSIADTNAKCLSGSVFTHTWNRYVFADKIGAITYTDNVYVNDFSNPPTGDVENLKLLFDGNQANILKSFGGKYVNLYLLETDDTTANRVLVLDAQDYKVKMTIASLDVANKFNTTAIRQFISSARDTHVIVDKNTLVKALTRLGIFDKNVDLKVLDYSEIRFDETGMTLYSNKTTNYERIPYSASQNPTEHTSIIRFDDLINRIKVMNTKTVDISYTNNSDVHALLINGNIKELLHENFRASRQ